MKTNCSRCSLQLRRWHWNALTSSKQYAFEGLDDLQINFIFLWGLRLRNTQNHVIRTCNKLWNRLNEQVLILFSLILGHLWYQYQPIFGFLFLYIHLLSPFPSTWLSSIQRMINSTFVVYCDTMFHPAKAGIIRQKNIVFHDETLAHFSVPKRKKVE